jgi:hypothetical protein
MVIAVQFKFSPSVAGLLHPSGHIPNGNKTFARPAAHSPLTVPPTIDHPGNHGFTHSNKLGKRDGRRI